MWEAESDFESLIESDFEFDEAGEFDEFDELAEYDERAPRRGRGRGRGPVRPPVKTPPRGNATVKPPRGGVATKAELDATAKKLDARIATASNAIKTVDTRSRAMEARVNEATAALKKEITFRKKETGDLKRGLDESRQLAMIVPILTAGAAPDDKFAKVLPIMLYSGALGGGSGGSAFGGSDNNGMMMMALAMTLID